MSARVINETMPIAVIPANAGIHFDLAVPFRVKVQMDSSIRWNDEHSAHVRNKT